MPRSKNPSCCPASTRAPATTARPRSGTVRRAAKTDPRLVAYADVDEANCAIGVAIALGGLRSEITRLLTRIQNELFDVGADLCSPFAADAERPAARVTDDYVGRARAGL